MTIRSLSLSTLFWCYTENHSRYMSYKFSILVTVSQFYICSQLRRGSLWLSWSRATSSGPRGYTVATGGWPRCRHGNRISPRVMGNRSRVATVREDAAVLDARTSPNCASNCCTRRLAVANSPSAWAICCKCPKVACSCSRRRRSCRRPISPSISSSSWSGDGASVEDVARAGVGTVEAVVEAAVIPAGCPHTSTSKTSLRNPWASQVVSAPTTGCSTIVPLMMASTWVWRLDFREKGRAPSGRPRGSTGAGTAPGSRNWLFPLNSASGGRAASCMAWTLVRWCALRQWPCRSCSSRSRVRHFGTGHWYRTMELSWKYRQWTSSFAGQPVKTHPGTGHCTLARLDSPPAWSALVVVPSICNQLKKTCTRLCQTS